MQAEAEDAVEVGLTDAWERTILRPLMPPCAFRLSMSAVNASG